MKSFSDERTSGSGIFQRRALSVSSGPFWRKKDRNRSEFSGSGLNCLSWLNLSGLMGTDLSLPGQAGLSGRTGACRGSLDFRN